MASKSKKRYLARQYMAVKSITQHVPNGQFLTKIKENKEDEKMSKLLGKMLNASFNVQNVKAEAKNENSVKLFRAEYHRLQVASEVLEHFSGFEACNPVDRSRLELSASQESLNYATLDAHATDPAIFDEAEKLPSDKLQSAIQIAKNHYTEKSASKQAGG